jgi:hypothetical protein
MSNPQGSFVQFYSDSVHMTAESEKEGRPIFKDMPHIRKMTPGDGSNMVERVAKQFDIDQFPREWEIFQRQQTTPLQGTPLEQWPQVTRAQVKEAKYFEIHTVEQMAEISDASCQRLGMGFAELRTKAKVYLASATATADAARQATENENLRQELEALKNQMAELAPRRGRPPKSETEEA